jgi:hypothetical protein
MGRHGERRRRSSRTGVREPTPRRATREHEHAQRLTVQYRTMKATGSAGGLLFDRLLQRESSTGRAGGFDSPHMSMPDSIAISCNSAISRPRLTAVFSFKKAHVLRA